MQFNSFSDFFSMGGYGFYVWLSFCASALLLIVLLFSSKAGHQHIINNIAKRKQREDKLRQAKSERKQKQQTVSSE